MKRRKRLLNKFVSIFMIVLMIVTGFIQPVGAAESKPTVESTEPASATEGTQNAVGHLSQDGTSLQGVTLSLHSLVEDVWYDTITDQGGNFGFTLPDGEYQLDGVWLESGSKWYPLEEKVIKIVDGSMVDENALQIELTKVESVEGTEQSTEPVEAEAPEQSAETEESTDSVETPEPVEPTTPEEPTETVEPAEPEQSKGTVDPTTEPNKSTETLEPTETVVSTGSEELVENNVKGTVTKAGAPVKDTLFSIHTIDGNVWYDVKTEASGSYNLYLPNGEYMLDGIWVEENATWYQLDQLITIVNGQLVESTELNIELEEDIPPLVGNVTGTVLKDGQPIVNELFSVHTKDGSDIWYSAITNANGQFSIENMVDGEYQIDGIWVSAENKWYELNQVFTVSGSAEVKIDLGITPPPSTYKVTGKVTKGSKPVTGEIFSIHTTDGSDFWYSATTDAEGNYTFELPTGEYQLDGVWVNADSTWYTLNQAFTVEGDLTLNFELTPDDLLNVTGTVVKGESPIKNEWVSVHTTGSEQIWYDVQTYENGSFAYYLPDGEYLLEGIWVSEESKWYSLGLIFNVQGGELVGEAELNINLMVYNVNGTLSKDGAAISNVLINIHTTSGEEVWSDTKTNENGEFKLQLPDGEYQMNGVWVSSESKWYPLEVAFTIQDDVVTNPEVLNIDLTEKQPNVEGFVTKDGQPLSGVWVNAHSLGVDETWYNAKTDENGYFELTIPDGFYQIDGIWVDAEGEWYVLENTKFQIYNGGFEGSETLDIDLSTPQGNVNGTVQNGSTPVTGVWVSTHTVSGEGKWYDVKTDENGHFSFNLPDGDYQIDGIWVGAKSKWYPLEKKFSVVNGTLVDSNELAFNLQTSADNVNGVVTKGSTAVAGILLSAYSLDSGKWYSAQTNENGAFSMKLPDGDYQIDGIWVSADQMWYPLNRSFTVLDGVLLDPVQLHLDLTMKPVGNIQGHVTDEIGPIGNAEISIVDEYWNWEYLYTNSSGEFSLSLTDGNYKVEGIYFDDEYLPLDMEFVVEGGLLYINGTQSENLIISVPSVTLNGTVVDKQGQNYSYASIQIDSYNDGYYSYYTSSNSDQNGDFSSRLADGEYQINGVYTNEGYTFIEMPFEIVDGTLVVNGQYVESLEVVIPSINVYGKVIDHNHLPIADGNIELYFLDRDYYSYNLNLNENGEFTGRLADGNYRIVAVNNYDPDYEYIPTFIDFSIHEGVLTVNGEVQDSITIQTPQPNFIGQLTRVGEILNNSSIDISYNITSNHSRGFVIDTDENGYFSNRLSDGSYTIESVQTQGESIQLDIQFDVIDGVPSIDFSQFDINLLGNLERVQGTIVDETGNTITYGSVGVWNPQTSHYFYANVNENGQFLFDLEDGDYVVTTYATDDSDNVEKPILVNFSVMDGLLTVDGEVQETLSLQTPENNFNGQLFNGDEVFVNAKFELLYEMDSGRYNGFYVETDENGYFSEGLSDGHYRIHGFSTSSGYVSVNAVDFDVIDGVPSIDVSKLDLNGVYGNVTGMVQDGNGVVTKGYLNIEDVGIFNWYSAEINNNGEFGINLPDGNYIVNNYWSEETGSINLQVEFTVEGGLLYINGTQSEDLIISIPTVTLNGTVVDEQGNTYPYASIQIDSYDDGYYNYFTFVHSDRNGDFSYRLADGKYQVNGVHIHNEGYTSIEMPFEIVDGAIVVDGKNVKSLEFVIPSINVYGKVIDQNQLPIADGDIEVYSLDTDSHSYNLSVNENGEFTGRLADGNYLISAISNYEYIPMSIHFSMHEGVLTVNGEVQETITIQTPPINFTGQLTRAGEILNDSYIHIWYDTTENHSRGFGINTDENGYFSKRLGDGSYTINYVDTPKGSIDTNIQFEVIDGVPSIDVSKLDLNTVYGNVTGRVQDTNGVVTSGYISIEEVGTYEWYSADVNSNGEFGINLPDGNYIVSDYYSEETGSIDLYVEFTVENGVVTNPLVINLPSLSLKGTIEDENGPMVYSDIQVKRANTSDYYSTFISSDENGYFEYRLEDGQYEITAIHSPGITMPVSLFFEIIDGKMYVNGSIIDSLTVKAPAETFIGQIVNNGVPVAETMVILYDENQVLDGSYYSTKTDENGYFAFRLPDGVYKIESVSGSEIDKGIYRNVEIKDGTTNPNPYILEIGDSAPIGGNLQGIVSDSNGPVDRVTIDVYGDDWTDWNGVAYHVETNDEGKFGVDVPNGDYTVSFQEEHKVKVSVIDGKVYIDGVEINLVELMIPDITLTGVLTNNGAPLSNGYVEFIGNGEWHWMETDEDGRFNYRLKDGDYQITSASSYDGSYEMDTVFSLIDGKMYQNGVMVKELQLTPPTVTNITGQLITGSTVEYGHLDVYRKLANNQTSYFTMYIEENGQFSEDLIDGDYLVTGAYTEFFNGPINQSFSVVDGQLFVDGVDQSTLMVSISENIISGTLVMDASPLTDAQLKIKQIVNESTWDYYYVTTDANGQFSLRYPDGDYQIVEVSDSTNYEDYLMNTAFNITDGKIFINGVEQSSLFLQVADPNFYGQVVDGGVPMDAVVGIVNTDTDQYALTYTDGDGNYSFRLPNGNYLIEYVAQNESNHFKVINKPFTVENGVVSLSPYIIDMSEF